MARAIALRACERDFLIRCETEEIAALVKCAFGGLVANTARRPVRSYWIAGSDRNAGFHVGDGTSVASVRSRDELLFHLDKDITLVLQHERRDLFFLHAAVVAAGGRAVVLPAYSGTGKSTLTLAALVESGLDYLSDELAPIDLARITVAPYPHALCLKSPPPPPYTLPRRTLALDGRYHVPADESGAAAPRNPLPIAAVIFLRREGDATPMLTSMTPASAAARFMAHSLNALAHRGSGLEAAAALGGTIPCFDVDTTNLRAAARAIASLLVQPACDVARRNRCFSSIAL